MLSLIEQLILRAHTEIIVKEKIREGKILVAPKTWKWMRKIPNGKVLMMRWRTERLARDMLMEVAFVLGLSTLTSYIVMTALFENSYLDLLDLWLLLGGRAALESQHSI